MGEEEAKYPVHVTDGTTNRELGSPNVIPNAGSHLLTSDNQSLSLEQKEGGIASRYQLTLESGEGETRSPTKKNLQVTTQMSKD